MDQMLQIALGVIPAFLLLLVFMLVTKRQWLPKLVAMVLLAAVAVVGVTGFAMNQTEEAPAVQADPGDAMELVYALMASGDSQGAEELLGQLMGSSVYSPEYTLCRARMYALQGNYVPAKALYEKAVAEGLSDQDISAELDMAALCVRGQSIDQALIEHDSSYADDEVLKLLEDSKKAQTELADTVDQALEDKADDLSDELVEGAEAIVQADALYQMYLRDEAVDEEEVKSNLKKLSAMEKKNPGAFSQPAARLARLKLRLIQGDHDGIAEDVSASSDYKELMVVSELYLNGYIKSKDFSDQYVSEKSGQYQAVLAQLQQLYNGSLRSEGAAVRRQVKSYINELEYRVKNPAISKIQENLEDYAQSNNATDGSKIYLQLSQLAQDRGSNSVAGDYLSSAMNTAGDCTDKGYTDPMFQVIDVINNKEDTESLKNIDQYVDQILENSPTMELHTAVRIPAQEEEEPDEEETEEVEYDTYFSDYVSQKRTSISIVNLDTSNFSEIVLDVSVDSDIALSADRLKELLSLTDCGASIKDFQVEDVTLDKTNVILVCDTSGSMDGAPIDNLREAVKLFVADKTNKENIGLVTFSSGVDEVYGLDSTVEQLNEAAANIYASGGTNIYDSVIYAVSMMEADKDAMNIIILMSDGEDNGYHGSDDINANVVQPCLDKNIVLYSVGLGYSVDSAYLDSYATGTGGSYLYVSDSQTLATFYEYLHNLIANRYRITFKAVDTVTNDRTVRVQIQGDELAYAERPYSLGGEGVEEEEVLKDKYLYGLDTRLLYKSDEAQTVTLRTAGFVKDDAVSVTFKGELDYSVSCGYHSENSYKLTIPANIAVGEYDMVVTVNGYTAYFEKELVIGAEDFITTFGPYTFTSCVKKEDTNSTYLSGYVCMNSWLHFKGSIALSGDLENDVSVELSDASGSYIRYSPDNAKGIAKLLAEKNVEVSVPMLGQYTLYNDNAHSATSSDYKVDKAFLPVAYVSNFLTFSTPSVSLYPNAIRYDLQGFDTKFPFQGDVLKASGVNELFSFDWEGKVILTNMTVGLDAEFSSEHDSHNYTAVNMGSMPIYLNPAAFEVKVNTVDNEYFIKYMTRVMFLPVDGLGCSLSWSGSLVPKEIRLYCDVDLSTNISGVPVTFSDFELAVSDIDINTSILNWAFEGKTKISVAKVSTVLPKLDKYVGDVAFCSLSDTTLKFSLGQRYIMAGTEFKLFDKVKVGAVQLECGNISYTNEMLGMQGVSTSGLRVVVNKGLDWDSDNCDINMTGEVEIAVTDKYMGAMVEGDCTISVEWWIFNSEASLNGKGLIGVYKDHSGDVIFTVRATGYAGNKHKGINVTWSKRHGKDVDTKYY